MLKQLHNVNIIITNVNHYAHNSIVIARWTLNLYDQKAMRSTAGRVTSKCLLLEWVTVC